MARATRKRIVFLDAVCVGQADIAERGSQVLLMGDICRIAQATLGYLGDADGTTARAFANIRLLHPEAERYIEEGEALERHRGIKQLTTATKISIDTGALLQLFRCLWFQ